MSGRISFTAVYETLLAEYGPQGWWPADSPFEVMVGAVLIQRTQWPNAARVVGDLRLQEAREPLLDLLADKSLRVRSLAVIALGRACKRGDEEATAALYQAAVTNAAAANTTANAAADINAAAAIQVPISAE